MPNKNDSGKRFLDKVALVTGGAQGIGAPIAHFRQVVTRLQHVH